MDTAPVTTERPPTSYNKDGSPRKPGSGCPPGKRPVARKRAPAQKGWTEYVKSRPDIEDVWRAYITGGTCSLDSAAAATHPELAGYAKQLCQQFGWTAWRRVFNEELQKAEALARVEAQQVVLNQAASERRIQDADDEVKAWVAWREQQVSYCRKMAGGAKTGKEALEWGKAIEMYEHMKPPKQETPKRSAERQAEIDRLRLLAGKPAEGTMGDTAGSEPHDGRVKEQDEVSPVT